MINTNILLGIAIFLSLTAIIISLTRKGGKGPKGDQGVAGCQSGKDCDSLDAEVLRIVKPIQDKLAAAETTLTYLSQSAVLTSNKYQIVNNLPEKSNPQNKFLTNCGAVHASKECGGSGQNLSYFRTDLKGDANKSRQQFSFVKLI
jgi:hypothetical protein